MTYRLEPLTQDDSVREFECGEPSLDRWLIDHALTARGQGTKTYLLRAPNGEVAGYAAISPHAASRHELTAKLARGAPQLIPGYLIAKLAIAEEEQGAGLGAELLLAVLTQIIAAARSVGGRLVFVDALNDKAEAFYEALSFIPCGRGRLVMKLSTAARQLGLDWP
ncbi:MAG: GNAT family N-acetyltransferase [Actinomycetota bacterium]